MSDVHPPLLELIELVALDPTRNIRRRYSLHMSVDLFGAIMVEQCWGRVGTRGQTKRLAFADLEAAERHTASVLRRRDTAEQRIGVAYREV